MQNGHNGGSSNNEIYSPPGAAKIDSSSTFNLAQVHASRRPSNVSTLQSLLHRAPKLYQYSPDQMEVIVHRSTGEVEKISYKSTRSRKKPKDSQLNGPPSAENHQDSSRSDSPSTSIKDLSLSSISIRDSEAEQMLSINSVNSIEETKLLCSRPEVTATDLVSPIDTTTKHFVPNASQVVMQTKQTNTEVEQCLICDSRLNQLRNLELELTELRHRIELKDAQLQTSQQRIAELTSQNFKLKVAASGMRKGLNQLAKIIKTSNEKSEVNDKRISDVLSRSWSSEDQKSHLLS